MKEPSTRAEAEVAVTRGTPESAVGAEVSAPTGPLRRRRHDVALAALQRGGVFIVFALIVVGFSLARPSSFVSVANVRNIFDQAVVLALIGVGLTLVLIIGEFDLSFGAVVGLAGAVAVLSMRDFDQSTGVAMLIAVGVGGVVGVVNGLIVAYGRVPAFIGTLAIASVVTGVERSLTGDSTIFQGVNESYIQITRARLMGIPVSVFIGLAVLVLVWVILDLTVFGRRIYAVGGSREAARIAGVRTERIRWAAFVILGMCAGLAGVIVTSRSASSFPNSGIGLLLPAYAATFLGFSALGGRKFHPAATYFGVIFMGTLATGLIMLQFPSWTTDLVQGLVLASAVLLARKRARS